MLLAVVSIGRPGTMAAAEKPAVILDAGHGGMDTGARSDEGGLEKTIVLAMVTQLNKDLANQWRVVLTRDGDYRLTASERAGTANRAHGDVFLSIHTGGGFSRQTSGVTVFTSEAASSSPAVSTGAATTPGREAPVAWEGLQDRHLSQSRRLAHLLQHHLTVAVASQTGANVALRSAPLAVLMGADMPAVLVEIGTLTNPADAAKLERPSHLKRLSQAVGNALTDFFHNKSTISTTDLQQ